MLSRADSLDCHTVSVPQCQQGQSPASASASSMQVPQLCWEEPLPGRKSPWGLDSGASSSVFLGRCLTRREDPCFWGSFTVVVTGGYPHLKQGCLVESFCLGGQEGNPGPLWGNCAPFGLHPRRQHCVHCGTLQVPRGWEMGFESCRLLRLFLTRLFRILEVDGMGDEHG